VSSRPAIEPNAIYTREQAAQLLGTSLSTLKTLIRTGQLAVSQPVGMRRIFIRGACILDMLALTERNGNGYHRDAQNKLAAQGNWDSHTSAETLPSRAKHKRPAAAHGSFDKRREPARTSRRERH